MKGRWLGGQIVALSVGVALSACATQQATSQAMTIAGAAAVVIGASMAADEQCYAAGPGEGGLQGYCSPGLSKGERTAAKGLAAAGVGLAAAGYALKPKGPDRMQRAPADPDAAPSSPYRLIRREPEPAAQPPAPDEGVPSQPAPTPELTSSGPPASEDAVCRPEGSVGPASPDPASCPQPPDAAPRLGAGTPP
jgi:hypothetical protein